MGVHARVAGARRGGRLDAFEVLGDVHPQELLVGGGQRGHGREVVHHPGGTDQALGAPQVGIDGELPQWLDAGADGQVSRSGTGIVPVAQLVAVPGGAGGVHGADTPSEARLTPETFSMYWR